MINEHSLDPKSIDDAIKGYLDAYELFLKTTGFIPEAWEIPLYSKTHDYGGTPDLVGSLHGNRLVVDIKSSSNIDPAVEIQTAGQAILWNENNPNLPLSGCAYLQLRADGTYRFKEIVNIEESLFLDALRVYRWKLSHKRKSKSPLLAKNVNAPETNVTNEVCHG